MVDSKLLSRAETRMDATRTRHRRSTRTRGCFTQSPRRKLHRGAIDRTRGAEAGDAGTRVAGDVIRIGGGMAKTTENWTNIQTTPPTSTIANLLKEWERKEFLSTTATTRIARLCWAAHQKRSTTRKATRLVRQRRGSGCVLRNFSTGWGGGA